MVRRNVNFTRLHPVYLFADIAKQKAAFLLKNPHAQLISLGIGDTTEPIVQTVDQKLVEKAQALGTMRGYSGYGPEQGDPLLREKIALAAGVKPEEVFVSDGSKCDIGRLQHLFGTGLKVAVQDPTYPAYVDNSIIGGSSEIVYLACQPENGFFPEIEKAPPFDLLYFCSPNNPTGAVATHAQLERLVKEVKCRGAILLFDAAYSRYIQDPTLPRSIFEIAGAREVAIELGSFSKIAGFTGVRLGWTIVPEELHYEEGGSVRADWQRIATTCFNGASNIAQAGGVAVLEPQGLQEVELQIAFYLENASLLKDAFEKSGFTVYGGGNAPYLWIHFPGRSSWEVFEELLEKAHIVTTPGVGFGPAGEGFVRVSPYGHRSHILEAIQRIGRFVNKSASMKN